MTNYPYTTNNSEPFLLFKEWYDAAQAIHGILEPTAMTLSTVQANNRPSSRIVLLKNYDERGFCFYTNLTSRKGKELDKNQNVALNFYWDAHGHQVRIEGKVERVTEKESDDYFTSRKRGSQIGAWGSKQSLPMASDEELVARIGEITKQFGGAPIPRPPFWGGFRVVPDYFEFWENGEYRLHKRITYSEPSGKDWKVTRIYP
jgi:pyridoxamine 5'-phosphate oxidase